MNSKSPPILPQHEVPARNWGMRLLEPCITVAMLYLIALVTRDEITGNHAVLAIITFFVSATVFSLTDHSHMLREARLLDFIRVVLTGWMIVMAVLLLLGQLTGLFTQFSMQTLVIWLVATPVSLLVGQMTVHRITYSMHKTGQSRSVLIVGVNDVALKLADRIAEHPGLLMQVEGFFDDRDLSRQPEGRHVPVLGTMDELPAYARNHNISTIFISQPISAQPRIRKLLNELQDTTASIYFLPDLYVFDLIQARFDSVAGLPVVAICETPFTGINNAVKRVTDIVLTSLILLMLLPIMLSIAIAVKITSPGPIVFRQRRYGLDGEEIIVYKFRSMTVAEDGDKVTQAKKNDSRLTPIGGFLRRSSLDELPQFINVLQGRMSIVGPRPHAVAHNELYRKQIKGYMLRHKVKPGITGWAQVNGFRGETDTLDKMEARIAYDLDYLRRWSLMLDLWIIVRTIKVTIARENAY
ncbi:undecaprenyl-phosphate glucose phosphotransferase [uncultured Oxalicibacterium sp.]|uniref:undecaprenyl-phosphate glucose phosphotransferase n=1 Tax=uncultured Oxalicibacterium sp. TaxID=1168540 RepID=UPI0025DA8566|nr:undecaprenyl-phosphate glucose phosphotransferase [uncultured Oxalicibacterium sp.]